jgi:uncharacterized RDD family membrane protein YckC
MTIPAAIAAPSPAGAVAPGWPAAPRTPAKPLQTFGQAPAAAPGSNKAAPKAGLQTFGESTTAPAKAGAVTASAPVSTKPPPLDLGETDVYGLEEEPAPPAGAVIPPRLAKGSSDDDENANPYAPPQSKSSKPRRKVEIGGVWPRIAASFLDSLVMVVVIVALIFGLGALIVSTPEESRAGMIAISMLIYYAGAFGFLLLYEILMLCSSKHATLGKMALGLQVTDDRGKPITPGRAIGRTVLKLAFSLIPLLPFISGIVALCNEKRQALHDLCASTFVVKSR